MNDMLDQVRERLAGVDDPMTLLAGLFANAPIGLQVYLPTGQSLLTNQAFRDIFGTEPPPEYRLFDDPLIQGTPVLLGARRAFAGELVRLPPLWYDTPKQPLARGGVPRRCAVECTWMPLFDREGRVSHIVLLYRDATAERLAQEQVSAERDRLRETQNRLQALLDHAPAVIFVEDLQGRPLVLNREAVRALGEPVGSDHALFSAEGKARLLADGRPITTVETLPTASGPRQFLVTRFPIRGSDDAPTAIGGIAIDVTERRQEQERLRQSEERFAHVFRSLPTPALFSRLSDRRFLDVNDAWLRLTGYTREETLGSTSVELELWDDPAQRAEMFRQLAAHGRLRDFSARLRTKSGAQRELALSVDRLELAGEPCLLLIAHDETEVRQLERELRQSQKMEAVGRLAGGVAHDFNNILTAISGADTLLLEGLAPNDPLRRYAEQIKRSVSRAATLTRQLLTFTRKQPVQPIIVDPNDAARAVVDMLQRMIGADVELRTDLGAAGRVEADAGALEQVVLNLAVNARDAMPRGGRLSVRTADVTSARGIPDGRWVLVGVSDNGVGMDAAVRARIFEPFFTTKDLGKGTGLGLSTVYGIVKQCGGHILVDSKLGQGTDIRVYLPRADAAVAAEPAPERPQQLPGGHETVLLVEDDEAVREFVELVLGRLGYRVLVARDGVEALALAESFADPIHLLLSDVVMPRMDGRELARRIAERRPDIKVIHMSGYLGDAARPAAHGDLRATMIAKPFERDDLARIVRHALDGQLGSPGVT